VRSRLAWLPQPAPAASQRPAPASRLHIPSASVWMTRHHRGFIHFTRPVFPSLSSPDGTRILGPVPRASHPAVTHDARRGGDGPCALDRALHLRHQPNLPRCVPLISCGLVSHSQLPAVLRSTSPSSPPRNPTTRWRTSGRTNRGAIRRTAARTPPPTPGPAPPSAASTRSGPMLGKRAAYPNRSAAGVLEGV
jgi:hypothetical protein